MVAQDGTAGAPARSAVPGSVQVGVVAELWRYPVKSLGGERVEALPCGPGGAAGDRRWAVVGVDGKPGSGKSTRRFRRMPGLLSMAAATDASGSVWITFADGTRRRVEDPGTEEALGRVVGEEVRLAEGGPDEHLDDSPLHLVTTAELAALARRLPDASIAVRRFRPNVVVDAPDAPALVGRTLRVGDALVHVRARAARCVMVTMAQPALPFVPRVLSTIEDELEGCFGVYATVERPGTLRPGDALTLG